MLGHKLSSQIKNLILGGLMGGSLLAAPSKDRIMDLRFRLVWKGGSETFLVAGDDLDNAEKKLKAVVGDGYTSTDCYRTLSVLRDKAFQTKLIGATRGNEKDSLPIEFYVQDDQTHAPDGIWPHVAVVGELPTMRLGETGWTGENSKEQISNTMLHEAGHMGDGSTCKDNGYGPDEGHYIREIIAPSGAFAEGWGQYTQLRDAKAADFTVAHLQDKFARVSKPGKDLKWENSKGTYVEVAESDLTLWDFVSNEAYVGGVLIALDDGGKNREILQRALGIDQTLKCRTLADFALSFVAVRMTDAALAAGLTNMVEAIRDSRVQAARTAARAEVEKALKKFASNLGAQADFDLVLSGKLGTGMERHTRPRSGTYTPPVAAPAAELVQVPAEAGRAEPDSGILGQ